MKKGDIVTYRLKNKNVLCEIININNYNEYTLKGLQYRFIKTCTIKDIHPIDLNNSDSLDCKAGSRINDKINCILNARSINENHKSCFLDTVLHLDSDMQYLNLCLQSYEDLGINAMGIYLPIHEQPSKIFKLLQKYDPAIIVITGHDSFIEGSDELDLDNYENSHYFIESVKKAREFQKCKDDLIIIAGACQSCYEKIIEAGANYASSPKRILVHALDPSFIVEKIIFSSINYYLSPLDAVETTNFGLDGYGGIETRGRKRISLPSVFNT